MTITVTVMMAATMSVILMTMMLTRDGDDYSDLDSDYGSFNDDGPNGDDLLTDDSSDSYDTIKRDNSSDVEDTIDHDDGVDIYDIVLTVLITTISDDVKFYKIILTGQQLS